MFLLDRFFDGTFLTFGIEVISFADRDQEDRIDPMVYVFPRMTKCTFHKFGTSGEIEKHDALCILPLNIFNEKIYIFLWFWMLILGKKMHKYVICTTKAIMLWLWYNCNYFLYWNFDEKSWLNQIFKSNFQVKFSAKNVIFFTWM